MDGVSVLRRTRRPSGLRAPRTRGSTMGHTPTDHCPQAESPSRRATRLAPRLVAFATAALGIPSMACSASSSASSGGPPPVYCDGPAATVDISNACDCEFLTANKGNKSPNDTACNVGVMGQGAICSLSPSNDPTVDTGCTCFSFNCAQDLDHPEVLCGYYLRRGAGPDQSVNLKDVDPSACVGQHHCLAPWGDKQFGGTVCTCQATPCAAGAQDLPSCVDTAAQGMLRAGATFPGDIAVTDCRVPSSTLDGG